MCGIAGIISSDPGFINSDKLRSMSDLLAHRGPDGEGQWINEEGTVGLCHRRLSIIDLSENASQPMHYLDRYSIIFNGEIYNYIELREQLKKNGCQFKTSSDTEVLLALYHQKKEECLSLLDGMFAIVIYDKKEQTVFCARDRFGEKPFFYSFRPGQYFIFGSEMKAIKSVTAEHDVNNRMLYNYLSFGSLVNKNDLSETFFRHIQRLPHAHYIRVNVKDISIEQKKYWDINIEKTNKTITINQAAEKLQELFYTSVNRRLRSDVNVGSSLSGGLDSSLIVCVIDDLIKKNKAEHNFNNDLFAQKTFSARFPGFKKDEGSFMQMVIDKTNVDPHFVYPDDDKLVADIDHLMYYQEEPFGGASILVQYEVMKLASQNNVTVLLDGQGADELLAGYHRYYSVFFREMELRDKRKYKAEYNAYLELQRGNTVNAQQKKDIEYHIRKWMPGKVNGIKKTMAFINQKKNNLFNKDFFAENAGGLYTADTACNDLNSALYKSTMGGDLQTLLRYADRNSMANSREVRLPFLSHELVEFIFSLPAEFKIYNGWTKYIMREAFKNILPEKISQRLDKIGYEPPQQKWMENPAVKENIIASRETLVKEGILNKRILNTFPGAYAANERGDNSWEHLMAGKLFTQAAVEI